ncbi:MAG: hypothetical protein ABH842_05650 [Candidatus Micrarchaeota archaeon]
MRYVILFLLIFLVGCTQNEISPEPVQTVPHQNEFGIYELDIQTGNVTLIYSFPNEVYTSSLRLNSKGDKFVFSGKIDGNANENSEIFTINIDGSGLQRITNNSFWDLYPAWSQDGSKIAFLSMRDNDLDIYVIGGNNESKLYDSGSHDADIDWKQNIIAFTSGSKIWVMKDDGTEAKTITNPVNGGVWGSANLPIGDYDPRLSVDGKKIVFERLEDPNVSNGAYNLFVINSDGTDEKRLTNTGYAQGLASWSYSGDKIVYTVAAINNQGKYDIYIIDSDGTNSRDITPSYFPPEFLCHSPIFSKDDSKIYFIGQWWEN